LEDEQWKSVTLALSSFEVFPQLQAAHRHKGQSSEITATVAHTIHCSLAAPVFVLLWQHRAAIGPLMLSPGGFTAERGRQNAAMSPHDVLSQGIPSGFRYLSSQCEGPPGCSGGLREPGRSQDERRPSFLIAANERWAAEGWYEQRKKRELQMVR